ncbi:MAG TPA: hypothetical protein VGK06_16030 [Methanosarcina sp.]|jgi:hypothetical protein
MATKTSILQVIRKHCLECCSGSYKDVENCASGPNAAPYSTCALWVFRSGRDPDEPSEAMQEKGRRLTQSRKIREVAQMN